MSPTRPSGLLKQMPGLQSIGLCIVLFTSCLLVPKAHGQEEEKWDGAYQEPPGTYQQTQQDDEREYRYESGCSFWESLYLSAECSVARKVYVDYDFGAAIDNLITSFRDAALKTAEIMQAAAIKIFGTLALLELLISVIIWYKAQDEVQDMLEKGIWKALLIAFYFSLIITYNAWFPPIIDTFELMGQAVHGLDARLNPANLVGQGAEWYANGMGAERPGSGIEQWLSAQSISMYFTTGLVFLSFIVIAAQLTLILVEATIVKAVGVFFIGFSAFRGTAALTDNFIAYLFNLGIRIFLIYLIVGVWEEVMEVWANSPGAEAWSLNFAIQVTAGSVCMAVLTFIIPNGFASKLTQGMKVGIGSALWKLD